jgi:hypothetical protein
MSKPEEWEGVTELENLVRKFREKSATTTTTVLVE